MSEIGKSPAIIKLETSKLDFFDGYKLQKEAEIYLKEEIYDIIVDMSMVTYISSRGLGILVDIHKKCQKNGRLVICNVTKDVMSVFKLTVLNSYFVIVDTLEDAITAINTKET